MAIDNVDNYGRIYLSTLKGVDYFVVIDTETLRFKGFCRGPINSEYETDEYKFMTVKDIDLEKAVVRK